MNHLLQPPTPARAARAWIALGLVLAFASKAPAQQTNTPASAGFSNFQIIVERNIFDPNRSGRLHRLNGSAPKPRRIDAFSLVGTMSYRKGAFAFFDGTGSEFKQVLEPDGVIGGYKVVQILPDGVDLETNGQRLEMKVGAQMMREDAGPWRLLAESAVPLGDAATNSVAASNASPPSGNMSDILTRLMQKRQQELK